MNRRQLASVALSACALLATSWAQAQSTIRLVVGFAPGGSADIAARLISERMAAELKQPVVVENKPGASGIIAAEFVKKSPADGHTLLMPATGHLALNPIVFSKISYDTRDFAPVTLAVASPHLLVVPATSPVTNVAELVALAKSKPGGLSYASQGTAAAGQIGRAHV